MRRFILGIFLITIVGAGLELILLEHVEGIWQALPLGLMLLSLLILGWALLSQSTSSLRIFQFVMILFVISGLVGIGLHYKGNAEFELEMYPSLTGLELFWKVIKGATPVLAPGTMIALGLIGWAFTLKHPRFNSQ